MNAVTGTSWLAAELSLPLLPIIAFRWFKRRPDKLRIVRLHLGKMLIIVPRLAGLDVRTRGPP